MGKTKPKKTSKRAANGHAAPPSYTDIALQFVAMDKRDGAPAALAAVKKLVDDGVASKATLHKAGEHLAQEFDDKRLEAFADKEYPIGPRGQAPPESKGFRDYSVQEIGGRAFLRVPSNHLNIKKTSKARVTFEPGPRIVITPVPAKAKAGARA